MRAIALEPLHFRFGCRLAEYSASQGPLLVITLSELRATRPIATGRKSKLLAATSRPVSLFCLLVGDAVLDLVVGPGRLIPSLICLVIGVPLAELLPPQTCFV